MKNLGFDAPVDIIVGLGFPCAVTSVVQAMALLEDMPRHQRDTTYVEALEACRAALIGTGDAAAAAGAFAAFADRAGLSAPHREGVAVAIDSTVPLRLSA